MILELWIDLFMATVFFSQNQNMFIKFRLQQAVIHTRALFLGIQLI